jgi:hypothetical protein
MGLPCVFRRTALVLVCAVVLATAASPADKKATVSIKASPKVSFAPARIILTAELKGGPDDSEELYCPSVEWEWGDGTKSQSNADCEPYEKGKTAIKRRYVIDHTFQTGNNYRVEFRLKQKNRVVAAGQTTVTVRPGLHDGIGDAR